MVNLTLVYARVFYSATNQPSTLKTHVYACDLNRASFTQALPTPLIDLFTHNLKFGTTLLTRLLNVFQASLSQHLLASYLPTNQCDQIELVCPISHILRQFL